MPWGHRETNKSSSYWGVRTWGKDEMVGIFQTRESTDSLSQEVMRNISKQLGKLSINASIWYPSILTKAEFETYQAFGFTHFGTH